MFQTGDILLFQSNFTGLFGWWAYVVSIVTGSRWTHVAMIIDSPTYVDPSYKGLYVIESGSEPWSSELGTIVSPIAKVVGGGGHSLVAARRVYHSISDIDTRMAVAYAAVKGKPYDTNILDLAGNEFRLPELVSGRKLDAFVCSTLVGYLYTAIGLLKEDTSWFYLQPWHFSEQYASLPLNGCTLGPEVPVTSPMLRR